VGAGQAAVFFQFDFGQAVRQRREKVLPYQGRYRAAGRLVALHGDGAAGGDHDYALDHVI